MYPLNLYVENLTLSVMMLGGTVFGMRSGQESEPVIKGISAGIRGTRMSFLGLCPPYKLGSEPSKETKYAYNLVLDFQVSMSMRDNYLLCKLFRL